MIRILLLAILFMLIAHTFWRVVEAIVAGAGSESGSSRRRSIRRSVKLVKDPVCGTWVTPREELAVTRGGATHYFCSDACRRNFQKS